MPGPWSPSFPILEAYDLDMVACQIVEDWEVMEIFGNLDLDLIQRPFDYDLVLFLIIVILDVSALDLEVQLDK